MTIDILTNRYLLGSPPRTLVYDLEDIIVDTCDGRLLPVLPNSAYKAAKRLKSAWKLAERGLERTVGLYQEVDIPEEPADTLLLIAMNGRDLSVLNSYPGWRERYNQVVAYVFDAWIHDAYALPSHRIDHWVIPIPEIQTQTADFLASDVAVIPFGHDVLGKGSANKHRPIDVMTYGRTSDSHVETIGANDRLSLFISPKGPQLVFPEAPYGPGRPDWEHKNRLLSKLSESKISLAFENLFTDHTHRVSHVTNKLPVSVLTPRWLEGLSSGCVVVGKRPNSELADELIGWKDATIELSGDAVADQALIAELAQETDRLHEISQRNYTTSLTTNDWRLRITELLNLIGHPIPEKLSQQVTQLSNPQTEPIDLRDESVTLDTATATTEPKAAT